jgi:hypothetical protein
MFLDGPPRLGDRLVGYLQHPTNPYQVVGGFQVRVYKGRTFKWTRHPDGRSKFYYADCGWVPYYGERK